MPSPRMASSDSLETQPATFDWPMPQDSLFHVLTACGRVAARGRKKWRNDILIHQHWKYRYLSDVGFDHFLAGLLSCRGKTKIKEREFHCRLL